MPCEVQAKANDKQECGRLLSEECGCILAEELEYDQNVAVYFRSRQRKLKSNSAGGRGRGRCKRDAGGGSDTGADLNLKPRGAANHLRRQRRARA
eukprot:3340706-Rhodomonas_salina.1